LPPGAKLFGTFGFLSPYKGFDTAIRALKLLPPDHHLLIFGGVHPQAIKRNQAIDPYIETLLHEGHLGRRIFDELSTGHANVNLQLALDPLNVFASHPQSLDGRVHFMGVLPDEDFMSAMAICDAVLLPYLEVGQSSSGPISVALDMGCRVIASRTAAFLQLARYHPNMIEFFDIGNYRELADRMSSAPQYDPQARRLSFNAETNAALYIRANTPPGWPGALPAGGL